ncbi:MAG: hypothetical protein GY746_00895 [Gammaproteobacteria bacterium]|nr:hypothetical protein [Gammaproteobacteria bacterium]MCP4088339.1 hypothetical protein [Gammaproteobacteria bacterium]MCP4275449.1 hypothetical protein [Gammaproteobacteria bacterium]MCP4830997.1 hypothetical protein [Gammaproteobacteria bacterium]MCP4927482.1 hypothetical protein [Gammaproteobacteria bacterium]
MTPYDAIFLALLASRCINRPQQWWLVVLAPLLSFVIGSLEPLGRLTEPLTALFAVALAPRWAPVGLLLVVPEYSSLTESIVAAAAWFLLDALFGSLLKRVNEDAVTPHLRGWPIQLLILGVLYYSFLPLVWI